MRRAGLLSLALAAGCAGPVNPGGQGTGLPEVPGCVAEVDGVLTADELVLALGVEVTFAANAPGTTVAAPIPIDDVGVTLWDLSEGPAEVVYAVSAFAPTGALADVAPGATAAIAASLSSPSVVSLLRAVGSGASREIEALGLATVGDVAPAGLVRLRYDAPVTLLRAPMRPGDAWGGQATFRDARLAGIPNAGVEDWTVRVDHVADVLLPGGLTVRDVLAVEVTVERAWAVAAGLPDNRETTRMIQLIAPCVGEVGRLVFDGREGDRLSELRRLLP